MLAGLTSGYIQDMIAKTAEARAKSIAMVRQELTGVSAFPILGDDGVKVEPWPAPSGLAVSNKAAITVTPLRPHRLGEAFEALRDAADAHGGYDGLHRQHRRDRRSQRAHDVDEELPRRRRHQCADQRRL